jgi:hypothetical protein
MNSNPEKIKNYIYINKKLINFILQQISDKNIFKLFKLRFDLLLKFFNLSFENKTKSKKITEKMKLIYNYLEKNNQLKEPGDYLNYTFDYYCMEKQYFYKISLSQSKIESKYNINKINFYVSVDRTFSTIGNNSPLFLIHDNRNNNIVMDGSSGYSIFKLLMEDYLKCNNNFLKQINENTKIDFAKDPINFFRELGCSISDKRYFETLYLKRSTLKDSSHNIVYTFGYPIYITSST